MSKGGLLIRNIYFYLVSVITLVMIVIASIDVIDLGLKMTVFTEADYYQTSCEYENTAIRPKMAVDPALEEETPAERDLRCAREKEQMIMQRRVDRQRSLVKDIAMLLVATPLFILHFRIAQKEWKEARKA